MNSNDREFSFEIKAHLGVLNKNSKGWTKEINLVSWNGNPPKLDIREWEPGHQHMSRGITLRRDEAEIVVRAIYNQLKKEKEAEARAAREAEEARMLEAEMEAELGGEEEEPVQNEEPLNVDEDGCIHDETESNVE